MVVFLHVDQLFSCNRPILIELFLLYGSMANSSMWLQSQYAFIYISEGSIKIWDLGAGQDVKHYEEKVYGDEQPVSGVHSLQFLTHSQDKQRLLIASGWDNELRLYNVSYTHLIM